MRFLFYIFVCLMLAACGTVPQNDEHEKALALASENAPGILALASLPLQYYCAHHAWPQGFHPSPEDQKILWSIHHLQYQTSDLNYQAHFQLQSYVKDDYFSVDWDMIIAPPNANVKGAQTVVLTLEARRYAIFMPMDFQYSCAQAES